MARPKRFVGARLRRLRQQRGLAQAALAQALRISPSYLNQIEHDQRPLTPAVQARLEALFGPQPALFDGSGPAALVSELREALAELGESATTPEELELLAGDLPGIAHVLLDLHRRQRAIRERADALAAQLGDVELAGPDGDPVRDYFNRRRNHVAELDDIAEAAFREHGLVAGQVAPRLRQRLLDAHGIRVQVGDGLDDKRQFDPATRMLSLPDWLQPGQQAFQMAAELALREHSALIDRLVAEAGFSEAERIAQARIGLSNYYAGALVMPYGAFLDEAEAARYDIDRLAHRFGVGFEAVCHRLSTLARPGRPGLPFFFVRVDRAGNVSKRHSATDFHFSHVGGACPLWIVYEAFNQPGRVLTQVARMPDGRSHFWLARQVESGPVGHGRRRKTFAVSLGCDLRHAGRLVYSRGLDLQDPATATPIGPGCKVCERTDCVQRAFPALRLLSP
ncbi:short-chain fatty acyl-CoA regulator family protein [Luteimonas sp. BDR2-5]|uniref:helix-turn-helix domain-containing protein n=1 Tax=Proluteimonas luteida TaxID=2878685 RepID=UPI001E520E19|nr:short-chain fatty acyl-CoA regulator family protein [Luteimonas sp. BDR2-5]MCD9029569.1 short-chain fatty acyl-CoA regulator family protein [Luteimonas sp. BDR2-5]